MFEISPKKILYEIQLRYEIKFDAIGTDGNRVHFFLISPPRYSPSEIIRMIKNISARELFRYFPDIKEELWGGQFWSDGGYVGTVGDETTADVIRNYVLRQGTKQEKADYKRVGLFI